MTISRDHDRGRYIPKTLRRGLKQLRIADIPHAMPRLPEMVKCRWRTASHDTCMKTNPKILCLLFLASGLMGVISSSAQYPAPDPGTPFGGLWRSPMGSIVNIKKNYGVLIYTPSGLWKEYLNKITIKNIRRQDGKWVADEWVVTSGENIWLAAEWELVGNRVKRSMTYKGERLSTFFVKTDAGFFPLGTDPEAYYQRGIDYRRLGRYQEAISDYNRAIALNPAYVAAYYNRGMASQDLGEYDQAISDFNKVIQLDPGEAAAYCHRGMIYYIKEEYGRALKDFKRTESLGGQIHPALLKMLEKALGAGS